MLSPESFLLHDSEDALPDLSTRQYSQTETTKPTTPTTNEGISEFGYSTTASKPMATTTGIHISHHTNPMMTPARR